MPSRDEELGPLIRSVFLPEEGEFWCDVDCSQQEFRFARASRLHPQPARRQRSRASATRNDPDTDFHAVRRRDHRLDARRCEGRQLRQDLRRRGEEVCRDDRQAAARSAGDLRPIRSDSCRSYRSLPTPCQHEASRLGYTVLYDGARRHWDRWAPTGLQQGRRPVLARRGAYGAPAIPEHPWFHRRLQRGGIHTALNAQIQGDAARHTKLWMRAVWREGIVPLLQMHDGLELSVTTREQGELVARLACEAVKLEVPMRADIKFGRSWGDAKHTWEELTGTAPVPEQGPEHAPQPEPQLSEASP